MTCATSLSSALSSTKCAAGGGAATGLGAAALAGGSMPASAGGGALAGAELWGADLGLGSPKSRALRSNSGANALTRFHHHSPQKIL